MGGKDNAWILVAAYMHNIGFPSDFGAGCFYGPIMMWGSWAWKFCLHAPIHKFINSKYASAVDYMNVSRLKFC